jgi:hypothetical protein
MMKSMAPADKGCASLEHRKLNLLSVSLRLHGLEAALNSEWRASLQAYTVNIHRPNMQPMYASSMMEHLAGE